MKSGEQGPQPSSMGTKRSASAQPLSLAPRARAIVDAIEQMAHAWLQPQWDMALDETEMELFRLAERASSNAEERACLDSLTALRAQRADLAPRLVRHVRGALQRIGAGDGKAIVHSPHAQLELLDAAALEETLALDELAARSEARTGALMFDLGHRFAALAASPVPELDDMPLGPHGIARALRDSVADSALPTAHRVVLYRQFDRKAMARVEAFFAAVNDYLINERILPNLRAFLPLRGSSDTGNAAAANADTPAADNTDAPVATPTPTPTPTDEVPSDSFAQISVLLQQRRQQAPAKSGAQIASPEQLQEVLALLQARAVAQANTQNPAPPSNMQDLRRDMLAQLRQLDPQARTPRLAPAQLDVIELMTMLFDRLGDDVDSDIGHELLQKVQTPLLRVALDHQDFFTEHRHPARRWLNSAAEACSRWAGDGDDSDPALVKQLQSMVARINQEYAGDPAMFEEMRADIDRHVQTLERKAQVTERRYIEASKGRERLQLARMRATELIDERLDGKKVSSLNRALLQQAWADVLALTLLRQGEDSETFEHQLQIADALSNDTLPEAADNSELSEDIEHALTQVGIDERDARRLAIKVTGADATVSGDEDEPVTRTELALKLKQRKRVGAATDDDTDAESSIAPGSETERMLDYVKTLPFGTWLQVDADPASAPPLQRKIAWYSTQTGRCLLVNQRGIRVDDTSLVELARALVANTTRLLPAARASLIDRAWNAIVAKVKSLSANNSPALETTP